MALIVCPECGAQVSELASNCPNCGYPISKYVENEKKKAELAEKQAIEAKKAEQKKISKVKNKKTKKPLSKKAKIIIASAVVLVIAALVLIFLFQFKQPYDKALPEYQSAISSYSDALSSYKSLLQTFNDCNDELDAKISETNEVIDSGRTPLDEEIRTNAIKSVNNANSQKIDAPKNTFPEVEVYDKAYTLFDVYQMINDTSVINDDTSLINNAINLISIPDYSKQLKSLGEAKTALEASCKQYEQVTNPSESFVIRRLSGIPGMLEIKAVTEDHDPNGNLNKAGGYTATVYFLHENVDEDSYYDEGDAIDIGTDGGGAVEVYANREDAEKRDTYLATYDGGIFDSGSHTVCGTVVVRTSTYLTASQQKELEQAVIAALTELE